MAPMAAAFVEGTGEDVALRVTAGGGDGAE